MNSSSSVTDTAHSSSAMERNRVQSFPTYGIDGYPFMWGFFIATSGLLVAGAAAPAFLPPTYGGLAILLWLLAFIPLALGLSMLTYAYLGKQRMRDHLLRQRAWRGDEVVLDIGAGRGLMAVGAALRAPRGRIVALDIWRTGDLTGNSPDGLRRNAKIENVDNIEIVTGDARRLDFADESIDVVMSVFCIHNIEPAEDRASVCREIARVLKPGGIALIADFPTAREYVVYFESAGLSVDGPYRGERVGLGISGYMLARKG